MLAVIKVAVKFVKCEPPEIGVHNFLPNNHATADMPCIITVSKKLDGGLEDATTPVYLFLPSQQCLNSHVLPLCQFNNPYLMGKHNVYFTIATYLLSINFMRL